MAIVPSNESDDSRHRVIVNSSPIPSFTETLYSYVIGIDDH